MKKVIVPVIMAFAAAGVSAQQGVTPAAEARAKIVAELTAVHAPTSIKNSPVSFEEINESVQTLFDGNRIVRSSTGKFYRNSEGRVRREGSGGTAGVFGSFYSTSPSVSIVNPSVGQKYLLDSELKTARVLELAAQGQRELTVTDAKRAAELRALVAPRAQGGTDLSAKLREQVRASAPGQAAGAVTAVVSGVATTVAPVAIQGMHGLQFPSVSTSKYETRTEELGTRDFEGVSAEGTKRTTIIPAGAIGNERPIEIVYERWFSKELGVVVYSKNSDPRYGEQTYRITNIQRAEPDPSLFSVPTHYRRVHDDRQVYRIASPPRATTAPVSAVPVKSASTSRIKN